MIRIDCKQGSREWLQAHVGIPTASNFHRIVTPTRGEFSKASTGYLHQVLAGWLIGMPVEDEWLSQWMARGKDMEDEAVQFYELQREVDTEVIGFCLTDDRRAGCSPDRLVGDDGGLEIKCPAASTHVGYLLEASDKYKPQIQGSLWVTGREWWDFMSYCPGMPPALVRFERDESYIKKLEKAIGIFTEQLEAAKARLEKLGCVRAA